MSYTEYLRRKAAGSPVVIDRRTNTDASMYTMRQRHLASSVFFTSNRVGAINNTVDVTTNPQKAVQSYVKDTGRVPDASTFISHSAAWQLPLAEGKITLDPCCVPVLGPAPKSASDFTRDAVNCCSEPHTATELGPALFVDNTIRLKHLVGCCENEITKAIHTHPEPTPYASWSPRPEKGQGGIPVYTVASPSDARKVGDFNPRKIPYVEKKHGNDLNVNPRRVPGPYKLNTGIPHLKINDAFPRGCEGCGRTGGTVPCPNCDREPTTFSRSINDSSSPSQIFPPGEYTACEGDIIQLSYNALSNGTLSVSLSSENFVGYTLEYKVNGSTVTGPNNIPGGEFSNSPTLTTGDDVQYIITVTDCNFTNLTLTWEFTPTVGPVPCEECTNPQIYNVDVSGIPINGESPQQVSPYGGSVTPCVGDTINLSYTNSGPSSNLTFSLNLPAVSTVTYTINGGEPISVSGSGSPPNVQYAASVRLEENDVFEYQITVLSCGLTQVFFRILGV